jgi:hypothetical protein
MIVLAVDPGSEVSAWVLYDGERVIAHAIHGNYQMSRAAWSLADCVVIEQITSYGMAVGREVFETVWWAGRFHEAVERAGTPAYRLPRRDVKLHLCQSARAKDSNVRQAVVDKFGGKDKAIGRKAAPGPLYGVKADCWQALALAITWIELHAAVGA